MDVLVSSEYKAQTHGHKLNAIKQKSTLRTLTVRGWWSGLEPLFSNLIDQ